MSERMIARMMAPLARAVGNMLTRGTVVLVNASSKMQTLQLRLTANEAKDGIEHFEPYGFTSNPKPGAEALIVFLAGDRSHGITIITPDRRYRLTDLASGEMAIHDDQGQKVHIKRDKILIETPLDFEVRAANIKLHATTSYKFDVNGQGQKWDGAGVETWQDNDTAKPHHNHVPPEIP